MLRYLQNSAFLSSGLDNLLAHRLKQQERTALVIHADNFSLSHDDILPFQQPAVKSRPIRSIQCQQSKCIEQPKRDFIFLDGIVSDQTFTFLVKTALLPQLPISSRITYPAYLATWMRDKYICLQ